MTKNHQKKRKKDNAPPPPQPGDPNYKTPTQLRNARKRRKLKNDKKEAKINQQQQQQQQALLSNAASSSTTTAVSQKQAISEDPSLRYLSDPKSAPIVQKAIKFFQENKEKEGNNNNNNNFPVFENSPKEGWRTVAKLAVRQCLTDGCLKIGLFVPGSHNLLAIPNCQVHHPNINSAVIAIQKKCRQLHIQPFNETSGIGNLRHIAINIQRSTGKQQITLIWKDDDLNEKDLDDEKDDEDNNNEKKKNSSQQKKLEELCMELIRVSENNSDKRLTLHSLWVHKNNTWKHANNIFDYNGSWILKYGEKFLVEQLDFTKSKDDDGEKEENNNIIAVPSSPPNVNLQFPPQVFRQANIDAFTYIIAKIRYWLLCNNSNNNNKYKNCVELYGGVGTIGLHLVDIIRKSLMCSDENPYNKECFEISKKELLFLGASSSEKSKKICKNISYESKSATQMVESGALNKADLIIVDPPRKGLDQQVLQSLCSDREKETTTTTLVYVSCGFDAFCNDYEQLTTVGKWKLQHAEGHVLFPGSDAIETLAFFTTS